MKRKTTTLLMLLALASSGTFASTALAPSDGAQKWAVEIANTRLARGNYVIGFDETQEYTHKDRRLNGIGFAVASAGTQKLMFSGDNKVYHALDAVLLAKAGEEVTPTFFYSGNWMNGFVYLDVNQNGEFEADVNSDGTIPAGSDLMSFSHLEGVNSKGEHLNNGNVLNPPTFRLPENLKPGIYRLRYKVDWSSVDPAGRMDKQNGILKNGGAICDVLLNVHDDFCSVDVKAENGVLQTAAGEVLQQQQTAFGEALTVKAVADKGYVFTGLRVRHGYQLQGDSLVNDNPQYRDELVPAYLFQNGEYTLPASYMDGDVLIEGLFVKDSGTEVDPSAPDYNLNFDAEALRGNPDMTLANVAFATQRGNAGSLSVPADHQGVYVNLLNQQIGLRQGDQVNASLKYNGKNIHSYLYVDLNQDGHFSPMLLDNGQPSLSGELLSYTYYQGKNSLGAQADVAEVENLPSFRIPQNLPLGVYRARLKVDVDNIDPAGKMGETAGEQITQNGGYVVDFLLNIYGEKHPLQVAALNGNVYGTNHEALPMEVTPFETSLTLSPYAVAPGYEATEMVVKTGHHFDGPQYVHGNRQWTEFSVPTHSYRLPKDSIQGDVLVSINYEPGEYATYQLVFADEFDGENGTQPNEKIWKRCPRQGATWNRWLSDSKEVVYLKDGHLITRAIPNPDQKSDPVPMITGGIQSRGNFGFTYGKVECRAKANSWIGTFPAIWLMPEDQSAGWPSCGEIDIFECIDNEQKAYGTVHSHWTYDLKQSNNPRNGCNTPTDLSRYHTYGLEWDANQIRWFVDGKQIGSYRKSSNADDLSKGQWPFDKHFYLILNQSVGNGSWARPADVNHTYEFLIDWVRVYQKNGMQNTDGIVGVEEVNRDAALNVEVIANGVALHADRPVTVRVNDLQGRCLYAQLLQGNAQLTLSKGIYVINGQKVFVR